MDKYYKYIPNIFSLSRIVFTLIFIIAYVFYKSFSINTLGVCNILIFIIILTDILDGHIARILKVDSKLGSVLDPCCDLSYILGTSLIFNYYNELSIFYTLLIVFKFMEFIITSKYLRISNGKAFAFDKIGRVVSAGYLIVPLFFIMKGLEKLRAVYIFTIVLGSLIASAHRICKAIKVSTLNV